VTRAGFRATKAPPKYDHHAQGPQEVPERRTAVVRDRAASRRRGRVDVPGGGRGGLCFIVPSIRIGSVGTFVPGFVAETIIVPAWVALPLLLEAALGMERANNFDRGFAVDDPPS
jgi:hypothetical protein